MPKIVPANVIRRALAVTPEQAFVTREDLVAFGSALIDLLARENSTPSRANYAPLSDFCRAYQAGRVQMKKLLSTHLIRKVALPHGGVRYHREDAEKYLTAHYSVHVSPPAAV